MITKSDAIKIGKAIVAGANREKQRGESRWAQLHVNGALVYALDNLWYDVFSPKLREAFGFDKENFYKAVWEIS
jgi:hypothetical protein